MAAAGDRASLQRSTAMKADLSRVWRQESAGGPMAVFADGGHSLDFINKAFECLV
jgi:hypothetical protein